MVSTYTGRGFSKLRKDGKVMAHISGNADPDYVITERTYITLTVNYFLKNCIRHTRTANKYIYKEYKEKYGEDVDGLYYVKDKHFKVLIAGSNIKRVLFGNDLYIDVDLDDSFRTIKDAIKNKIIFCISLSIPIYATQHTVNMASCIMSTKYFLNNLFRTTNLEKVRYIRNKETAKSNKILKMFKNT